MCHYFFNTHQSLTRLSKVECYENNTQNAHLGLWSMVWNWNCFDIYVRFAWTGFSFEKIIKSSFANQFIVFSFCTHLSHGLWWPLGACTCQAWVLWSAFQNTKQVYKCFNISAHSHCISIQQFNNLYSAATCIKNKHVTLNFVLMILVSYHCKCKQRLFP
jgi:hypothetical protein